MSFATPVSPPAPRMKSGIPVEIPRDQWDRPLIVPPEGGEAVAYTRASNLGKVLDSEEGLRYWGEAMVALGMGRDTTLFEVASGLESYEKDKKKLSDIARQAKTLAGSGKSSNRGTALHSWIERIAAGEDFYRSPISLQPALAAYFNKMAEAGIATIARERFVVCDELRAAGTFDALQQIVATGELLIGDQKSGGPNTVKYPHGHAVQLAIYANGTLYDLVKDADGNEVPQRTPLTAVSKTRALLVHAQIDPAETELYEIDVAAGFAAAHLANDVKDWTRSKVIKGWGT